MRFSIKYVLSILSVAAMLSSTASAMERNPFDSCPDEIVELVFHKLAKRGEDPALKDLTNVGKTCQRFHRIALKLVNDNIFDTIRAGIDNISKDFQEPGLTLHSILEKSITAKGIFTVGRCYEHTSTQTNTQILKYGPQIAKDLEVEWKNYSQTLRGTACNSTFYEHFSYLKGVRSPTILFVAAQLGDRNAMTVLAEFTIDGSRRISSNLPNNTKSQK